MATCTSALAAEQFADRLLAADVDVGLGVGVGEVAALAALASRTAIEITSVSPTGLALTGMAVRRARDSPALASHGLALDHLDLGLDGAVAIADSSWFSNSPS